MEAYLQHRVVDEDDIYEDPTPPELSEDYLEAQNRVDDYLRMVEENARVFDKLYWILWYSAIMEFLQSWGHWLLGKLFILGIGLFASIAAGSVFITLLGIILNVVGAIKIRNFGYLCIVFIIGSVFVTNSLETASATIFGTCFLSYFFVLKVSTGNRLSRGKCVSVLKKPPTILAVDFWYAAEQRTFWINFERGYVGIV